MTKKSKSKGSLKASKKAIKKSTRTKRNSKKPNKWFAFFSGKTPEGAKIRNKLLSDKLRLCKSKGIEFDSFKFNSELAKIMSIEYRKLQNSN